MIDQFSRWIITLRAQVGSLQERLAREPAEQLEKEAIQYEAELQSLYAYAASHHLDLMQYYSPFAEIEQGLFILLSQLKQQEREQLRASSSNL